MRREEEREFHSDRRARVEGSEEEEDRAGRRGGEEDKRFLGRSMRVEGESWWASKGDEYDIGGSTSYEVTRLRLS